MLSCFNISLFVAGNSAVFIFLNTQFKKTKKKKTLLPMSQKACKFHCGPAICFGFPVLMNLQRKKSFLSWVPSAPLCYRSARLSPSLMPLLGGSNCFLELQRHHN